MCVQLGDLPTSIIYRVPPGIYMGFLDPCLSDLRWPLYQTKPMGFAPYPYTCGSREEDCTQMRRRWAQQGVCGQSGTRVWRSPRSARSHTLASRAVALS